jgi:hypothetical protein
MMQRTLYINLREMNIQFRFKVYVLSFDFRIDLWKSRGRTLKLISIGLGPDQVQVPHAMIEDALTNWVVGPHCQCHIRGSWTKVHQLIEHLRMSLIPYSTDSDGKLHEPPLYHVICIELPPSHEALFTDRTPSLVPHLDQVLCASPKVRSSTSLSTIRLQLKNFIT